MTVTMGKIYVEIERARLTRTLAARKEKAGDIEGATELLQEVAVETFGAMHKREKIDFIQEQVRLLFSPHVPTKSQLPQPYARNHEDPFISNTLTRV
jgi:hypothetical protein